MLQHPLSVYNNWSAYDELSDNIELTEALATKQLSALLRLREAGVRFDGYLMDAFWYDPEGAYRLWRKPHWPQGPDRWLAACAGEFRADTLARGAPVSIRCSTKETADVTLTARMHQTTYADE